MTNISILDDVMSIKKIDQGNSLLSIKQLALQCRSVSKQVAAFSVPYDSRKIQSIVFCGMGGSAYAARIIKNLYKNELAFPVDIISDYHLPKYVNAKTLVLLASYSGSTEETLQCLTEAIYKKAKLIGFSSGGRLHQILSDYKLPSFVFSTKYNPSRQPRLAQGYMQLGQISLLAKLKLIKQNNLEIDKLIINLAKLQENLEETVPTIQNKAKKLAVLFNQKIVNIIGADFLEGAIHAVRNPFHETAKHYADYYILPELNHHLLEGLRFPNFLKRNTVFWLIKSPFYSAKITKRINLTKDVIDKNKIAVIETNLTLSTKLEQVFELIQLGSFVTFYLSILHNVDASLIPWVDYFKEKLKRKV